MKSPRRAARIAGGVALVLANRLLVRTGLRERRDGWRRGAGLVLRGENATFVLSALALDVWSDAPAARPSAEESQQHVRERLATFLAGECECHVRVRRGVVEDAAEPCAGASYTLGFQPWVERAARFVRPDRWEGDDCSGPRPESSDVLLNIVCRLAP